MELTIDLSFSKSFGHPDPIVEFAEKLTRSGDKDDYRMGRSLMPKMRTLTVIVRGEEAEGVRFWGLVKKFTKNY